MIRVWFAFVVIFALFFLGIKSINAMSKMDKWSLTKTVFYSILCAVLTLAVLISIVILF